MAIYDLVDAQNTRAREIAGAVDNDDLDLAKELSKVVRDNLKKVSVAIQGESLRITAKSKDDLQAAIQLLRDQEVEVPLQFENYR